MIEAGLRQQLEQTAATRTRPPRPIRWLTVDGGLPPDLDLDDRESLTEWIRRERKPA